MSDVPNVLFYTQAERIELGRQIAESVTDVIDGIQRVHPVFVDELRVALYPVVLEHVLKS